jgi:hypothetical protein
VDRIPAVAEKASPKEGAIPKKCAPPKKQIAAKGKTLAVSPRKEAKATKKTVQPALAKDSAMPAIRAYEIKKCFFIGDWVAGLDGRQISQRYAAISVVPRVVSVPADPNPRFGRFSSGQACMRTASRGKGAIESRN